MVESYGAAEVFDYSSPEVGKVIRAQTGGKLRHTLDCITGKESVTHCYEAIARTGGRYACLEMCPPEWKTRNAVKAKFVMALEVFGEEVKLSEGYERPASGEKHEQAVRHYSVFQKLLNEDRLKAHPVQLVEGGFEGIVEGLKLLKSGTVSGKKLVVLLP